MRAGQGDEIPTRNSKHLPGKTCGGGGRKSDQNSDDLQEGSEEVIKMQVQDFVMDVCQHDKTYRRPKYAAVIWERKIHKKGTYKLL